MSHLFSDAIIIMFLDCLRKAMEVIGKEKGVKVALRKQSTYRWYGRSVGDYPLPAGFTVADLGKCEYVIDIGEDAYQIGVVPNKNGKGWQLLCDFWGPGQKLLDVFGTGNAKDGLKRLQEEYGFQVAKKEAVKMGKQVFRIDSPLAAAKASLALKLTGPDVIKYKGSLMMAATQKGGIA